MIRINLLATERSQTKKKLVIGAGQKLTMGCSLILVLGALIVGWRYWSLNRQSATLDADIIAAQQETLRLRSVLLQVQDFEQRKTQLKQRVALIEQLRKGQTGPVHMLDQISRALPSMLWLTDLQEQPDGSVVIEGRCTSMTSVSDFVANLQASGYFKRSIEIVSTATEPLNQPPGDLVKFGIKAIFESSAQEKAPAKQGA
jgi:type IV pilus assembly protein PilN